MGEGDTCREMRGEDTSRGSRVFIGGRRTSEKWRERVFLEKARDKNLLERGVSHSLLHPGVEVTHIRF